MVRIKAFMKKKMPWLLLDSKVDIYFLVLVVMLCVIGLIMMGSASYAVALRDTTSSYSFVKKQFIYLIIGLMLMYFISLIDYSVLKKQFSKRISMPLLMYIFSTLLLIAVLFSPKDENNIQRWIYIGGFQFQPSEITKFVVVAMWAYIVDKNYSEIGTIKYGFFCFLAIIIPPVLFLYKQPHVSCMAIILLVMASLLFVSGALSKVNTIVYSVIGLTGGIGGAILLFNKIGHVQQRISLWMDPFADPSGNGYQTIQSLYAVGSGGLFGVGFGNSRQKLLFLPEPQNDFVFAIVCEELGFVGAVFIMLLFAILVFRGLRIAAKSKDRFGAILAFGVVMQVGIQAMLNIAVVTNSMPNTGISLPFFSSGGTSLVMLLMQMGVVLSISRTATIKKA